MAEVVDRAAAVEADKASTLLPRHAVVTTFLQTMAVALCRLFVVEEEEGASRANAVTASLFPWSEASAPGLSALQLMSSLMELS